MKAQSTAKPEQSRHQDSRDRGGQGQGQQAMAVLDSRPEMAQQQSLLSLMAGSPRLQRKCACGAPSAAGGSCAACEGKQNSAKPVVLQKQLAIGAADDPLEREADRVADQVMTMAPPTPPNIQRQLEEIQPKSLAERITPIVQRQEVEATDEDSLQTKCETCEQEGQVQRSANEIVQAQPDLESRLNVSKGGGNLLPDEVRSFMEPRFKADFSHVRVHTDGEAVQMNRALKAQAFTYRHDIYFGSGKSPGINDLTAHELTHVVQQTNAPQGSPSPVNATIQRMLACPPALAATDPVPSGWKEYQGDSSVFHCGFRGILEDRAPTADDIQNECFYDHSSVLVTESHLYAGCRGTPNRYDSRFLLGAPHATLDPGGIVRAGAPAFITSRVYDVSRMISSAIQVVSTAGRITGSIFNALGDAIASGVLTAIATVDPGNWSFQGLPARSVRHLNVMGALLGSTSLSQNAETVLRNLTRRLDSFPIAGLLDDLAQDINQALQIRGLAQRVTSAVLGELSLLKLVAWLNENGIVQYVRPPEDIAAEQLAAQRAP
jgi:hypothetical protein